MAGVAAMLKTGLGNTEMMKMGPNDARHVVWVLGEFFFLLSCFINIICSAQGWDSLWKAEITIPYPKRRWARHFGHRILISSALPPPANPTRLPARGV